MNKIAEKISMAIEKKEQTDDVYAFGDLGLIATIEIVSNKKCVFTQGAYIKIALKLGLFVMGLKVISVYLDLLKMKLSM